MVTMEMEQNAQAMWEAAAAAEWERLNTFTEDQEKMREAADSMVTAHEFMLKAVDALYDAYMTVNNTVAEDRVVSLMNDAEDLSTEIAILKEHLKRGEC